MKGNAFSCRARLASGPADHGFQFQRGDECPYGCGAVLVLEGALHFLLLGASQPACKKTGEGKALKGTAYSPVPFQLLFFSCQLLSGFISPCSGTRGVLV